MDSKLSYLVLIHGCVILLRSKQVTEADPQCIIIQEKETISVPFDIPLFLKNANKTHCQTQEGDQDMLRCGQTDVYIKPECVCSFFHVYEATLYHRHSFCPDGAASDIVTKLKCQDCKKYSLNKNGPCINGGKLICNGDEVAPEVKCQCPPNYEGRLCENKIENVRKYIFISNSFYRSIDRTRERERERERESMLKIS
uniref:Uncharacterized protein LOC111115708 n=1 Tax=Crassostrea virginica TaxID=6565 RepID=A0A8B8C3I6_CRAVI|nr:uncharacterized protein LOC111115708 [Crassostrea virginica]